MPPARISADGQAALNTIEEMLNDPGDRWAFAHDTLESIRDFIHSRGMVTLRQETALENIRGSVADRE